MDDNIVNVNYYFYVPTINYCNHGLLKELWRITQPEL